MLASAPGWLPNAIGGIVSGVAVLLVAYLVRVVKNDLLPTARNTNAQVTPNGLDTPKIGDTMARVEARQTKHGEQLLEVVGEVRAIRRHLDDEVASAKGVQDHLQGQITDLATRIGPPPP